MVLQPGGRHGKVSSVRRARSRPVGTARAAVAPVLVEEMGRGAEDVLVVQRHEHRQLPGPAMVDEARSRTEEVMDVD